MYIISIKKNFIEGLTSVKPKFHGIKHISSNLSRLIEARLHIRIYTLSVPIFIELLRQNIASKLSAKQKLEGYQSKVVNMIW